MTDTEAKARAVIQSIRSTMLSSTLGDSLARAAADELERAIEREEATEARHAAELRELRERFSEVAKEAHESLDGYSDFSPAGHARKILAPFIIAAPDPLVEAIRSAMPKALVAHDTYDAIVMDVAAAVRKIGEAGE